MRKILLVLALLAAASAPAMAQRRPHPTQPTPEELQKRRDAAETDAKYKDALKRIKPGEAPAARQDPWADMRAPAAAAGAKH